MTQFSWACVWHNSKNLCTDQHTQLENCFMHPERYFGLVLILDSWLHWQGIFWNRSKGTNKCVLLFLYTIVKIRSKAPCQMGCVIHTKFNKNISSYEKCLWYKYAFYFKDYTFCITVTYFFKHIVFQGLKDIVFMQIM